MKKTDSIKKLKLIYSGELLAISVVFLVLGFLFVFFVISVADWKRYLFTYATLVGGIFGVGSFLYAVFNKKRRAKVSMLDKCLLLPASLFFIVFDIVALSRGMVHLKDGEATSPWFNYVIGGGLIYIGVIYIIQAIYHYYFPVPMMKEAIEEELAEIEKQNNPEAIEAVTESIEETPVESAEAKEETQPDSPSQEEEGKKNE